MQPIFRVLRILSSLPHATRWSWQPDIPKHVHTYKQVLRNIYFAMRFLWERWIMMNTEKRAEYAYSSIGCGLVLMLHKRLFETPGSFKVACWSVSSVIVFYFITVSENKNWFVNIITFIPSWIFLLYYMTTTNIVKSCESNNNNYLRIYI